MNSSKWGKEIRPPFLQDDEVFNGLSLEAAATQIMSWMSTKAVMTANQLKEKKANYAGGKEKADEPIKALAIEAGEDDATTKLHSQRFMFRTPLKDPKDYLVIVSKEMDRDKQVHLPGSCWLGYDNQPQDA